MGVDLTCDEPIADGCHCRYKLRGSCLVDMCVATLVACAMSAVFYC